MPAKSSEPRAPLERIHIDTIPFGPTQVDESQTQVHEALGDLLQLKLDGLAGAPLFAAKRLNRNVAEGWLSESVRGYNARVIRCIGLQAMKSDFCAASDQLRGQPALVGVERGDASAITYERAIPDWRNLAERTEDPAVYDLVAEHARRIAETLVPEDETGTTLGLLRGLAFTHGRHVFNEHSGLMYAALQSRAKSDNLGTFDTNFEAVVAMIRHEESVRRTVRGEEGEDAPLAELWNHELVRALRGAWMKDVEKQLKRTRQPHDAPALLMERLKMYMAMKGIKQHEAALRTAFRIPAAVARSIAGNKASEVSDEHVEEILRKLVDDKVLPASAREGFLAQWTNIKDIVAAAPESWVSRVRTALNHRGIDNHALALALDIRARRPDEASPVSFVKDSVDEQRVNHDVPMHAVASLASPTLDAANEMMRGFVDDYRKRPKNGGKEFSSPHLLMTQYALRASDLPAPFDTADIPAEAPRNVQTDPKLISAIVTAGLRRSADALERWIELYEPTTVVNAVNRLLEKVGGRQLVEHVPVSPKTTLPGLKDGSAVPTLGHLVTMVGDGRARAGVPLMTDWYLRKADLAARSLAPLPRCLETLAEAESTSVTAFCERKAAEDKGGNARKTAHLILSGETVSDERFETFLQNLGLDGSEPQGLFLRSVRASGGDMHEALERWSKALLEADREAAFKTLMDAHSALRNPPEEPASAAAHVERLIARKEEIVRRLKHPEDVEPDSPLLALLKNAPGLRESELFAWEPSFSRATNVTRPEPPRDARDERAPEPSKTPRPSVRSSERPAAMTSKPSAAVNARPSAPAAEREEEAEPDKDATYAAVLEIITGTIEKDLRRFVEQVALDMNLRLTFEHHWKKKIRGVPALAQLLGSALRLRMMKTAR